MSQRRTIIIAVAVGLAALTFFGTLLYLKGADDRAYGKAKLVNVLVVKQEIPKGTTGEQAIENKLVGEGKIPAQYRPGTAITTLDDIKQKVALTTLAPDQVLIAGQFVSPSAANSAFSHQIPDGQVAVTISVDQVHAVAGFIQPGDRVNVLVYSKDPTNPKNENLAVRVLYQNVNVIAVGGTTIPQPGATAADLKADAAKAAAQAAAPSLITVAVPLAAAEKLIVPASGASGSVIYLTLVPPNAPAVSPAPGSVDLNGAFTNTPLTPYE